MVPGAAEGVGDRGFRVAAHSMGAHDVARALDLIDVGHLLDPERREDRAELVTRRLQTRSGVVVNDVVEPRARNADRVELVGKSDARIGIWELLAEGGHPNGAKVEPGDLVVEFLAPETLLDQLLRPADRVQPWPRPTVVADFDP